MEYIKNFLFVLLLVMTSITLGQTVNRLDPYDIQYEPDVILVKFQKDVEVPLLSNGKLGKMSPDGLGKVFSTYGITSGERLFPHVKKQSSLRKMNLPDGSQQQVPSLYNIFKFNVDTKFDPKAVAEELSTQQDVVYAEPDYYFYATGTSSDNPLPSFSFSNGLKKTSATTPNDPLYGEQWYLGTFPGVNAEAAWDSTTGDTTQIIAIIDTGVDWDHPDLDDNIWTNWGEIPGNSIDDDSNGKIDDIRGWDFVNNDNNPNDDNSHGTHVAGIAAAEGNNGVGICGVAWNAKIMPVKMLQSSGSGSSSDLALAINYAADNGATVINMSLGSYAESMIVKTALENAYSSAVLVAAAGNDGLDLDLHSSPLSYSAFYPACYPFVLGVEATNDFGTLVSFSNYDISGPKIVGNSSGYNYEVRSPGVHIYNTFPNGNYHNLNGTSMACPVVAGAVSLLKVLYPTQSTEQLFARLIQGASSNILDIQGSMAIELEPDLQYITYTLVDTFPSCDGDGVVDAGETLEIYLTVKNVGGYADSVWSKLRLGEYEDPSVADIIDSTSQIGDISEYATLTGESNPFVIEINSDVVNNRDIVFEYEIGYKNGGIQVGGELVLTVQKGIEIGGLIDVNTAWTNDNFYIVVDNIRVGENVTVRIEPSTEIRLNPDKSIEIRGSIIARGKPDSLIKFINNSSNFWDRIHLNSYAGDDSCVFSYCSIEGFKNYAFHFTTQCDVTISDCVIFNGNLTAEKCFNVNNPVVDKIFRINRNVLFGDIGKTALDMALYSYATNIYFCSNNIINSRSYILPLSFYAAEGGVKRIVENNNIFNNSSTLYGLKDISLYGNRSFADISQNYWGTTDSVVIKNRINDFYYEGSRPIAKFWPYLTQPSDSAHGIVWKVELNSQNPQEVSIEPIGMETVQFDVYFNRAMDIDFVPFLTFGVRDPYTQNVVTDNAFWSSDSTIWSAYFDVGLETGDGINTIRVANAKDTDHFDIPIEDSRFQFVIQAAGAASNEFLATVGVGKVELEWPTAESDDVLGYNMYRIMRLTDSTWTDTTLINTELITDSTYTDYAVIPDSTYRYLYRVLGTDMVETDYSKSVAATPVNASSGDANGDLAVNVLDIVAIVNYILEENPQPFLFEAADVNADGSVNVLDIVSTVNIILGAGKRVPLADADGSANMEIKNGNICLDSSLPVFAMQFTLRGQDMENCELVPTDALTGFEIAKNETEEWIKVIAYSLSGHTINSGFQELFKIKGNSDIKLSDIVLADRNGLRIPTGISETIEIPESYVLNQNYPNPFNPETTISYGLPKVSDVKLEIYNVLGQRVFQFKASAMTAGYHKYIWNGTSASGSMVGSGVYFIRLKAGDFISVKKMMLLR
ncbi:S8 family serine peptidase [candidate division KSB1 bacterium]|nr:S8 family serine peptidase [candidate division KSB1 bacterium]